MSGRNWIETVAGLAIVFLVLYDIFRAAVLPRPAVGKLLLVKYLLRWLWRGWRWMGTRATSAARRETRLAAFGPVSVFIMFGLWAVGLIFGYALLLHGLGTGLRPAPQSFGIPCTSRRRHSSPSATAKSSPLTCPHASPPLQRAAAA